MPEQKEYYIWGAELIESNTMDQFFKALDAPFVIKGALMPDAHYGYSLPIGGVMLTEPDKIVPAWVGYDIGCGVCYVETTFPVAQTMDLKKELYHAIRDRVPVGFKHQDHAIARRPRGNVSPWLRHHYNERNADKQLGTMGGNNHFIEIGTCKTGSKVAIVIHSGSRGIGHDVGLHYMQIAGGGKAREGNFPLDVNSFDGGHYVMDMSYMLYWAQKNREIMLHMIEFAAQSLGLVGGIEWGSLVNNTHNHAEETKDGWIHRKGATKADDGVLGVVPGNPKVGSYVVKGRGNALSLCSSSHGAGRVMGRGKKAQAELNLAEFEQDMQGIVADVSPARLVESPRAYKAPREVMAAQFELVNVVDVVKPFICVKG